MDDFGPDVRVSDGLFERASGELEGGAVRVFDDAAGVADDEKLGNGIDDRTELPLVLPDALLRPLVIIDIGPCGVPVHDPPSVVAERGDTNEEPPVGTVPSPEASFGLPRGGPGKSACPSRREAVDVVQVDEAPDQSPSHAFECHPVVVEHDLIAIEKARPVRCDYRDVMRNEIDDLSQLAFPLADPFFCPLAIVDVGARPVPAHEAPRLVTHRIEARQEPAVLTVVAAPSDLPLDRHPPPDPPPPPLPY